MRACIVLSQSECAKTTVGTPLYYSPELCEGRDYNEKSDVWALGCLLFELMNLMPPFLAANHIALARYAFCGRREVAGCGGDGDAFLCFPFSSRRLGSVTVVSNDLGHHVLPMLVAGKLSMSRRRDCQRSTLRTCATSCTAC